MVFLMDSFQVARAAFVGVPSDDEQIESANFEEDMRIRKKLQKPYFLPIAGTTVRL